MKLCLGLRRKVDPTQVALRRGTARPRLRPGHGRLGILPPRRDRSTTARAACDFPQANRGLRPINPRRIRPMLKRGLVVAIGLLLATAAGAHAAATLTTAPFPGAAMTAGFALCSVTNVGTKSGNVTVVILDPSGAPLEADPFVLSPGHTAFGGVQNFPGTAPTTCRITVPSKSKFRGAFTFVNGNAPPTVITAQ